MYTEFWLRHKSEKKSNREDQKRRQNAFKIETEDGSWIELANNCV